MGRGNIAWRLLDSGQGHPFYNMALDEALLRTCAGRATLRLYSWEPPGLSLGYFQSASDFDLTDLRARGVVVVRRPTGGGAIYHCRELTFALVAGAGFEKVVGATIGMRYQRIHGAVIEALRRLKIESKMRGGGLDAPFSPAPRRFCFNRTIGCDIVADGRKLVGSAQRKTPQGFLQHGSIPLQENPMAPDAGWANLHSKEEITYESLGAALAEAFSDSLGVTLLPGELTPEEESTAAALLKRKYSTDRWNLRR